MNSLKSLCSLAKGAPVPFNQLKKYIDPFPGREQSVVLLIRPLRVRKTVKNLCHAFHRVPVYHLGHETTDAPNAHHRRFRLSATSSASIAFVDRSRLDMLTGHVEHHSRRTGPPRPARNMFRNSDFTRLNKPGGMNPKA